MTPSSPPDDAAAAALFSALKLEGFFPEFSAELCAKLFPRSGVEDLPSGARLIEESSRGRDLFVVLAGEIRVLRGSGPAARELARLGPGSILGEIALLGEGVRTAGAQAAAASRVFRLAYEDMGYLLKHNPDLARHLEDLARARGKRA